MFLNSDCSFDNLLVNFSESKKNRRHPHCVCFAFLFLSLFCIFFPLPLQASDEQRSVGLYISGAASVIGARDGLQLKLCRPQKW